MVSKPVQQNIFISKIHLIHEKNIYSIDDYSIPYYMIPIWWPLTYNVYVKDFILKIWTNLHEAKKKCVFTVTCQKNLVSVGGDYYFFIIGKTRNSRSRNPIFSFSKFPVKWRIMQFFYLLCSQFRQKASSWINKTLLLVKQQKWFRILCKNS
jgi:hypothetical protein